MYQINQNKSYRVPVHVGAERACVGIVLCCAVIFTEAMMQLPAATAVDVVGRLLSKC